MAKSSVKSQNTMSILTEPLCDSRDCLIVGSAPCVVEDIGKLNIPDGTLILGANGGAKIAYDHIGRCDILVTTSHLYQQRLGYECDIVKQIEGLQFSSVWVDMKSGICDGIPHTGELYNVSPADRSNIVEKACEFYTQVSTGVWAMCIAKVSGAISVAQVGISPDRNGHYGLSDFSLRDHVEADRVVLESLNV